MSDLDEDGAHLERANPFLPERACLYPYIAR